MTAMMDFYDNFERDDSPKLGNGWLDGHDLAPTMFEPLGIHQGGVVVSDPFSRAPLEDYQPVDQANHPPADDKLYVGISMGVRECPADWLPDIEVTWSGNWDWDEASLTGLHVESGPILHADPTSPLGNFGFWMSELTLGGVQAPFIFAASVGAPPELFNLPEAPLMATAPFPVPHVHGQHHKVRAVCPERGQVILFVDGHQASFSGYGYDPLPVPAPLLDSNLHGFSVDAHFVRPYEHITTTHVIEDIRFRNMVPVPKSINTYKHQALELANAQ